MYEEYADLGFIPITLLSENDNEETPSTGQLMGWAETYGLSHPVLADPNGSTIQRFVGGGSYGLPYQVMLAPGAKVAAIDITATGSSIEEHLPEDY